MAEITKMKKYVEVTMNGLIRDVEHLQESIEELKHYLKDTQVDLLASGDEAFERAKAQA